MPLRVGPVRRARAGEEFSGGSFLDYGARKRARGPSAQGQDRNPEWIMGKSQDAKKDTKKTATKSLAEKRLDKKAKKEGKKY
jgi:hypothetical protein